MFGQQSCAQLSPAKQVPTKPSINKQRWTTGIGATPLMLIRRSAAGKAEWGKSSKTSTGSPVEQTEKPSKCSSDLIPTQLRRIIQTNRHIPPRPLSQTGRKFALFIKLYVIGILNLFNKREGMVLSWRAWRCQPICGLVQSCDRVAPQLDVKFRSNLTLQNKLWHIVWKHSPKVWGLKFCALPIQHEGPQCDRLGPLQNPQVRRRLTGFLFVA